MKETVDMKTVYRSEPALVLTHVDVPTLDDSLTHAFASDYEASHCAWYTVLLEDACDDPRDSDGT